MKLQRLLTLVFLFNCLLANIAQADLVVVTHKDNQIIEVTREQVVYLFTGREQNFANGNPAVIIDQASDSRVRIDFYQLLLGKTVAQMNAYWARLLFTGNATPPKVLNSIEAIMKVLHQNKDAVAYIDEKDLDASIKVIYRLPIIQNNALNQ